MASDFMLGKWTFCCRDDDTFEHYMQALDVTRSSRSVLRAGRPTDDISVLENGVYQLKTITDAYTSVTRFRLGEPFDEDTLDGRTVKATMTLAGNTLVHEQEADAETGQKSSVIHRTFEGDTMILACIADDVVVAQLHTRDKFREDALTWCVLSICLYLYALWQRG